jgi:agmatine deiminase
MLKPIDSGYRMPAEWETHAATLLHWPSNRETWPGKRLKDSETVYLDIIETLHRYEPVILLVDISIELNEVIDKLTLREIDLSEVRIYSVPINDVWARDCGPVFIKNKEEMSLITDWEYNAWGEKYPPFDNDNALPNGLRIPLTCHCYKPGMVLEGGSIDTNGEGVFLTTESVLLNKNRNPESVKKKIEGDCTIIWEQKKSSG